MTPGISGEICSENVVSVDFFNVGNTPPCQLDAFGFSGNRQVAWSIFEPIVSSNFIFKYYFDAGNLLRLGDSN